MTPKELADKLQLSETQLRSQLDFTTTQLISLEYNNQSFMLFAPSEFDLDVLAEEFDKAETFIDWLVEHKGFKHINPRPYKMPCSHKSSSSEPVLSSSTS